MENADKVHRYSSKMLPIQLVAILSVIVCSYTLNFKRPESNKVAYLQNCVDQILERYTKSDDRILFINFSHEYCGLRLRAPLIIQNRLRGLTHFQPTHANFYVIIIPRANFEQVFNFLVWSSSWNPRAKFVLVLQEEISINSLDILMKYFIYNVVFIWDNAEGDYGILTYNPFSFAFRSYYSVGACYKGELQDDGLFRNKLPKVWKNYSLRVAFFLYPPFVMQSNEQYHGIEVDLFHLVRRQLGLKVRFVDRPFENWGRKLLNGSYEGGYGYLRRYEVDAAIGGFYANVSEHWDFDQSYPYLQDEIKWVVPAAKRKPQWVGVVNIFNRSIWVCTFISFLSVAAVLYSFGLYNDVKRYKDFFHCLVIGYKIFLNQSGDLPSSGVIRLMMGLWIYIGLIMTSAFQGRFMSALNFSPFEKQIANVDDLRKSGMAFGFYKDTAHMFSNPYKNDKFIYHNYVDCPIDLECLNSTAFTGDFATIKPKIFIQYLISTTYIGEDGRPLVYAFKDNVYNLLITMAFAKGFPILPAVNKVLLRLRIHGFVDFHSKRIIQRAERAIQLAMHEEVAVKTLRMDEIFWAFCLLFIGLAIATCVFVIEVIVFKCF